MHPFPEARSLLLRRHDGDAVDGVIFIDALSLYVAPDLLVDAPVRVEVALPLLLGFGDGTDERSAQFLCVVLDTRWLEFAGRLIELTVALVHQ